MRTPPRCRHFHCCCSFPCCCDLPSIRELADILAGRTRLYDFSVYYGGQNGEFLQRRTVQARSYKDAAIEGAKHSEHSDGARYLVTGPSDASRDDSLPATSYFRDQQGARIFVIRKVSGHNCACHNQPMIPIKDRYDFIGPGGVNGCVPKGYYRVEEV